MSWKTTLYLKNIFLDFPLKTRHKKTPAKKPGFSFLTKLLYFNNSILRRMDFFPSIVI